MDSGIKNRSLDVTFLSRVLNIEDSSPNGVFYVERIDLYLYFLNGNLVDYQSSSGLNEWAKVWKSINPSVLEDYQKWAQTYKGNDMSSVIEEINAQAEAWASVPEGWHNKYVKLHSTKLNTVNFVMLMVCHYGKPITLDYFLKINLGRYKMIESKSGVKKFKVDRFIYEFNDQGYLLDCYLSTGIK